jgi:hypothetical protein
MMFKKWITRLQGTERRDDFFHNLSGGNKTLRFQTIFSPWYNVMNFMASLPENHHLDLAWDAKRKRYLLVDKESEE